MGGSISWSVVPYTRFELSGHIPRLQVQSPVGVCTGSNQSMFLSHIDTSWSPSLSLLCLSVSFSLPPSSLS